VEKKAVGRDAIMKKTIPKAPDGLRDGVQRKILVCLGGEEDVHNNLGDDKKTSARGKNDYEKRKKTGEKKIQVYGGGKIIDERTEPLWERLAGDLTAKKGKLHKLKRTMWTKRKKKKDKSVGPLEEKFLL